MRKADTNLAIVALGAFALFAFVNRGKNGGANGGVPGTGGGQAILGATIQNIALAQNARMGRHLISKAAGKDTAIVIVTWTPGTVDWQRRSTLWPYRLRAEIGHQTVLGWKNALELGKSSQGPLFAVITGLTGVQMQVRMPNFDIPNENNQKWDVQVKVQAADSDNMGTPIPDTWKDAAFAKHEDALISFRDTSAIASASIEAIQVNQSYRQIGVGREDLLRHLVVSVPRGSNIRTNFKHSAGFNQASYTHTGGTFNQSGEFIPAFRTGFNPGMGQVGRGQAGRPFRQGFERSDLIRSLQ